MIDTENRHRTSNRYNLIPWKIKTKQWNIIIYKNYTQRKKSGNKKNLTPILKGPTVYLGKLTQTASKKTSVFRTLDSKGEENSWA